MGAQENAELIRTGYEAFGKGDIETVLGNFADDIRWHVPGRNPIAGDYTGHAEITSFFGKLQELSGGTFQLEMHDLLASDDHVVAIVDGRAERNGKALENGRGVHIWHVRDGKATEFWGMVQDPYGADEFWG